MRPIKIKEKLHLYILIYKKKCDIFFWTDQSGKKNVASCMPAHILVNQSGSIFLSGHTLFNIILWTILF